MAGVQLSSLRVSADLDSTNYVAGMNAKVAADKAGAASSQQVGAAISQTDQKISASGDILTRLSRTYVDGFATSQRFDSALRTLNRGLETGNVTMQQADTILEGIYRKYGLVADAADLMARGETRVAEAVVVANARIDANTAAHMRNNRAMEIGAHQRQNVIFQLQDVAVQLAGGQNPFLILMQQGPQITGAFSSVGVALRAVVTIITDIAIAVAPIAAAVGAVALAFAGLTNYINQTSDTTVSMGDVFMATLQVIGDQITGAFAPQIQAVFGWFQQAWDYVSEGAAILVNNLIRGIATFVETTKFLIEGLPRAFTIMGQSAANGFIAAIEGMVNFVAGQLNTLKGYVANFLAVIPTMSDAARLVAASGNLPTDTKFGRVDLGGTQALHDQIEASKDYESTLADIATHDYISDIADKARKLALAHAEEADKTGAATKKAKEHKDALTEQEKAYKQLAESIERTLGSTLSSLFSGPIADADEFFSKVLSGFAQIGQQNLQGMFDGVLGGRRAANDNGTVAGTASMIGQFVKSGAKEGTEAGLGQFDDFFKGLGVKGGMAGAASAGLGGLGIGYQTQSPLMGAVGGALAGSSFGPWGAAIGGIAGLVGGLLGMNDALKKARKALAEQQDAIETFIAASDGKQVGQFTQALMQYQKQAAEYEKLAKAAKDSDLVAQLQAATQAFKVTLGKQFTESLQASIRDLTGKGYINDLNDALAVYQQRLSDAQKLGVSSSGAMTELALSMRDVIDTAGLTNEQVKALSVQFPELAKGLNAALKAGISLQAANDNVDASRATLLDAYQRERDAISGLIDPLKSFIAGTKEFKNSLKLSDSLSTLSPFQKFLEAQRQFKSTSALAIGGDTTAQGQLQSVTQAYLEQARGYYGSSQTYASIFSQAQSVLDQAIKGATGQVSTAEAQLAALDKQVAGLVTLNNSVISVADAIKALQADQAKLAAIIAASAKAQTDAANANTAALNDIRRNGGMQTVRK